MLQVQIGLELGLLHRFALLQVRDTVEIAVGFRAGIFPVAAQGIHDGFLGIAMHHQIEAGLEIRFRLIRGVRAVGDEQAGLLGAAERSKYRIAHVVQTHLGQEIEIVVVENEHIWLVALDRFDQPQRAFVEHDIVKFRFQAELLADPGSQGNRGQRRIRLAGRRLFSVEI